MLVPPEAPPAPSAGSAGGADGAGAGGVAPAGGGEVDARGVALRLVRLEELARREPERAGDHDAGERLDRVVVGQHGVVVDLPGDRDPVLRLGELALQLPEVLVRLQLRIRLGDREQPAERLAQDPLGLRRPRQACGRRCAAARASVTASNVPRSCAA